MAEVHGITFTRAMELFGQQVQSAQIVDGRLVLKAQNGTMTDGGELVGFKDAHIDEHGHLILTYTNDETDDVGLVRSTVPEVLFSEASTTINPENYPGATRFKFEIWGGGGSGGGAQPHGVAPASIVYPGGGGGGGGYASFEILASELVTASVLVGSGGGSIQTGDGYSGYNTQLDLSISNDEGPSSISVVAGGGGGGGGGANWADVLYLRAGAGGGGGGSGPGAVRGESGLMDEPGCGGGLRTTSEVTAISESTRPNPQDVNDAKLLEGFRPEVYNSHSGGGHGAPGRGSSTPANRAGDSFLGGGGGGSGYTGGFAGLGKAGESVYGGGGGGGGHAMTDPDSPTESQRGHSQFGGSGGVGGRVYNNQPGIPTTQAEDGQWPGGGGGGAARTQDWSGSGASGGLKLTVYYS